jgi:hypothetical protein
VTRVLEQLVAELAPTACGKAPLVVQPIQFSHKAQEWQ